MPPPGLSANSTLAQINEFVAQYEEAGGPLTAMGIQGNLSVFTFDTTVDTPPTKFSVIVPNANPKPDNSTPGCSGTIWVSGVQTACTAYRPN